MKNVCPNCSSPDLRFGSRDPCEGDYYWCRACGAGPILFPLYHKMPLTGDDLEALEDIVREDRADRIQADKENEEPIIDSDAANAALQLVAQLKQKRIHDEIVSIQRGHGLVGRSS